MSDNEEMPIVGQNDWITVQRNSETGKMRVTVRWPYRAPKIIDIQSGYVSMFMQDRVVLRDNKLGSWTFEKGSADSLEEQAVRAARDGYRGQLRTIIVDEGLPVNSVLPSTQKTLLQEACSVGTDNSDCIRLLVDHGADYRAKTLGDGDNILHLLARRGTLEQWYYTIYSIGDNEADSLLFWRNTLGDTPLHAAAKCGNIVIYTLIVALIGPYNEIRLKNNEGKTPYELLNENCEELKRLVRESISYEDSVLIKHDEKRREELFTNARQELMLEHMSDFIRNSVYRDALYDGGVDEEEEEEEDS